MKNITCTFLLLIFSFSVNAQDWLTWSFQKEFKVKNSGLNDYTFLSLEVFVNTPLAYISYQGGTFGYDENTSKYSLNLYYGCISCGYPMTPPTTYFTLHLFNKFNDEYFSIIIPLTFDEPEEGKNTSNLGTITLSDFIVGDSNGNRFIGIRVKKDGTVYKYKKDEYNFPPPDRLYRIK